jgi:F0F1-type ATP synthase membrane subunit b/b'
MTDHGAHPGIGSLLLPLINFLLFVGLIIWKAPGPVREFFRARTERLRDALAAGKRALTEAEQIRAALERDVRELPNTVAQLKADVRAAAEREHANLLEMATRAADRIRSDARLVADSEVAAARHGLRSEVVEEAVRQATAILRGTIKTDDHERMVRDFVQSAGKAA